VVEEGGILAASRKLNTVQSNVTGRIRKLEEELGTELFFPQGARPSTGAFGARLLDYTRRMLMLERQTAAAVRQVGESSRRTAHRRHGNLRRAAPAESA
jgi:DNA-binding transcriptional LysR family regulator